MRGKLPLHNAIIAHIRITPADAGKTCLCSPAQRARPDHPRGCGENYLWRRKRIVSLGSPPRMRGKLYRPAQPVGRTGITPADAGKTRGYTYSHPKKRITPADAGKTALPNVFFHSGWDHPRGCGENAILMLHLRSRLGSPPRMRGKRAGISSAAASSGITPADAGKTKIS